ncbi:hypothetical protein GUJ93_ZPchr0013g36280 [Zizania palustris]|uniref:Uncharacterized protein n=1 Tax=Zizania palustris TaxID=103762 RepID=A0A8J5X3S4_ZIZPA|nr:hypothetical protein GUJ93_ZPchr0013g36280 [Zizania palustris]
MAWQAADTKYCALRRRRLGVHRGGIRGRISCSHRRPDHTSFAAEEGVAVEVLKGAVAALAVVAQISSSLPANAILYSPDTNVPANDGGAVAEAGHPLEPEHEDQTRIAEGHLLLAEDTSEEAVWLAPRSIPIEFKEKGSKVYTSLLEDKGGLQTLLKYIKENDPDRLSVALASSLDTGSRFILPFTSTIFGIPKLRKVMVQHSFQLLVPGGEPKSVATIQIVIDGYSAPLTAGNFVKLVLDGAYEGHTVPLEVMPAGQFEPLYRTPLSIQSCLGGTSFDERQFSVFGYTTAGREVLSQIKAGDIIPVCN